ncbi:unnamed protein product [Caenorhabditis bovis]|uniref:Uncharacterized protein n=1 Tax=Caenorhabditis bovis TaxID=2654633 RepID=A0A8S1EET3_9PELO|nr:unnamed protein product [Caenorhabditis bovis]
MNWKAVAILIFVLISLSNAEFNADFANFVENHYGRNFLDALQRYDLGDNGSFGGKEEANETISRDPVIFVHGVSDVAGGKMLSLAAKYRKRGYQNGELYATTYADGNRNNPLAWTEYSMKCDHVKQIRTLILAVRYYTLRDVDIVAFSLGVPIARKAILGGECIDTREDLGIPLTAYVDTFIGMAGPNHGISMQIAGISIPGCVIGAIPLLPICSKVIGLYSGFCPTESQFLEDINEKEHYEGKFVYSIYSKTDNWIGYEVCGKVTAGIPGEDGHRAFNKMSHDEVAENTYDMQIQMIQPSNHVEFNHPSILPAYADNFRHEKAASKLKQHYVTKERLPTYLIPSSYDIYIKPFFPADGVKYDDFTFHGSVEIKAKSYKTSDRLILNAYNFTILNYIVFRSDNTELPILSTSQDDSKQQLSLITEPNGVVSGEEYRIQITYKGFINNYLDGGVFYTSYVDPQGAIHYMIATHMEPFSARKVFPGFDEPAFKATFSIRLEYPSSQVALSNMKEGEPEILKDGWSLITFPTTPVMSSYLVAFAVGPYVSATYLNRHNTTTRAWGWTGTEQYLEFAAQNAGECLYQLGEYTGIKFPLEKADQLGLPEFPAGAMENWGLIIYKYQYIAYNPQTMTTQNLEAAAKVMCHELAHQWFGDLVTTKWWDDLFLNEGFADYFMTFIQKSVYPEQETYLDTLQVLNELQVGLEADVSSNAHPLVYPDGPAFDDITYNKGASLLRMLSDVLTPEIFRTGLQNYLLEMSYSNAVDEDLFSFLTEAAKQAEMRDWCDNPFNVSGFMQPYIHQTNFPLIRYFNNDPTSGAKFYQEPFADITNLTKSSYNYTWVVPLKVSYLHNPYPEIHYLFTECPPTPDPNELVRAVQWSLASITSATYGRIIYDDIGFDRLVKSIKANDISDNLKLTVLADEVHYLNREKAAGRSYTYTRFLSLALAIFNTNSSIHTPSYSVFKYAQPTLEFVASIHRDQMDAPLIQRMYKKMFGKIYEQLIWADTQKWDIDTFADDFLVWAVRYDLGDVRQRTMEMFNNVKLSCRNSLNGTASCNPYTTNLHRAIYCGAAKYAPETSDYFFQLIRFYNMEVVANPYFYQEYMALLEGMSCTQSPGTLAILLRLYTTSTLNQRTLFTFLKYNLPASDAMYTFLQNNPTIINSIDLDAYVDAMTYNWNSFERESQFSNLFQVLNLNPEQYEIFDKYMERITENWNYRNTRGLAILNWLYDNLVVIGNTPWPKVLDGSVRATNYSLKIQPYIPGSGDYADFFNMTFSATSVINLEVIKPITTFCINSHRIFIEDSGIQLYSTVTGTAELIPTKRAYKTYDEGVLCIPLDNVRLSPSTNYYVQFTYMGFIFANPDEGPAINYNYYTFNGNKGWIFTTDFEGGPGARSLLPCFDEPTYKSSFNITVTHPTDTVALSNNIEESSIILRNGWTTTKFQRTEIMSTYLLAICVGHFSNIAKTSSNGHLVRLWSWTGMEQFGEFALNVSSATLDFMEKTFHIPYALDKLDIMALPQYTTNAGAMENYGLIIGEYNAYLLDPDYATTSQLMEIAETSAHEVVHQWFGDMVTMDWWSDIFLNEGFAQYWFANGILYAYPQQQEYSLDYNRFLIKRLALMIDCIPGMAKPVISNTPPIFGAEPYYKGSSLFDTLSNLLTEEVFIDGLRSYLYDNAYSNASPNDLWKALTEAAQRSNVLGPDGQPIDIGVFMQPYTLNTSFPILEISQAEPNQFKTRQRSCMNNGVQWAIPVLTQNATNSVMNWFVGETGGNDDIWIRNAPTTFRIDNAAEFAFTRVNYDDQSWSYILDQLATDPNQLQIKTRAMLFDDAFYFYQNGVYSTEKMLNLTLSLTNENSLAVWEMAYEILNYFSNRFRYQSTFDNINNFVRQVTQPAFERFGFLQTESWATKRAAKYVTELNCLSGGPNCTDYALEHFRHFIRRCDQSTSGTGKCSGIDPDYRFISYCMGMIDEDLATTSNIQTMIDMFNYFWTGHTYMSNDQDNLLNGLGCLQSQFSLDNLISFAVNGIWPKETLMYIMKNSYTDGNVLYNYLYSYLPDVQNSPIEFSYYINQMITNWSTQEQLEKLTDAVHTLFFEELSPAQQKVWMSAIDTVKANNDWIKNNQDAVMIWIEKNFGAVNRI